MFAQVLAVAWLQYPASARVAMHAQEGLDNPCGRLLQSILRHPVHLEPAAEMPSARPDRRLIKTGELHLLQLGMNQAADSSCGLAGPVKYRRLIPHQRDNGPTPDRRNKLRVLRPLRRQAL